MEAFFAYGLANKISIREVLLYAAAVRYATSIRPWQSLGMSRTSSGCYTSLNPDIEQAKPATTGTTERNRRKIPRPRCNNQITIRTHISGYSM